MDLIKGLLGLLFKTFVVLFALTAVAAVVLALYLKKMWMKSVSLQRILNMIYIAVKSKYFKKLLREFSQEFFICC